MTELGDMKKQELERSKRKIGEGELADISDLKVPEYFLSEPSKRRKLNQEEVKKVWQLSPEAKRNLQVRRGLLIIERFVDVK